jgi:hypothetical protein
MPLDIEQALGCVFDMVRHGSYNGEMIGRITSDVPHHFREGDIVLFTDDGDGRTVTVETPYCQKEIDRQRSKGSSITRSTMVNFPRRYIERVAA